MVNSQVHGARARRAALVAALVLGAAPAAALAGPESASEMQELKQRISELEAQLSRVASDVQSNASTQTTLESRIAELQTAAAKDHALDMYWDKGIRMDSADKRFKFKFGGRIQNDWGFFDEDDDVRTAFGNVFQTGEEFRRARLYLAGTIYGNVGFKAQYDFEGGEANFKDVYISLKTGAGTFYVGNHYEPFGMEVQTSSKYTTFMERSTVAQIAPDRHAGISFEPAALGDDWNLRFGVFRNSDAFGNDKGNAGSGEWAFTGRIAGSPWHDEESKQALHVGLSASMRSESEGTNSVGLPDELARVRVRGAQHLGPRFVDTGTFAVDGATTLIGLEGAYVAGPFHVMAEYQQNNYDTTGGDADFDAIGVQAGWFLTGETRNYKSAEANFDRTKPAKDFGDEDGMGAWEIAVRWDTIDLNDGPIAGGEMDQVTVGLNWYLNPNTRVMWNYANIDIKDIGKVDYFGMRFMVDF